jgi:hypothetical protein
MKKIFLFIACLIAAAVPAFAGVVQYDSRGNEYLGSVDQIVNGTITDARAQTASLGALNAEAVVDLNGQAAMAIDARSGAFNGTLAFEGTVDGTNYIGIVPWSVQGAAYVTNPAFAGSVANNYILGVTGFKRVRTRVSAFTSGAVNIAMRASSADYGIYNWPLPTTQIGTATGAANAAVTLTLTGVAGVYHCITGIEVTRNATAALAGTATLVITTTNIPGSLAWSVGNAMAAGGSQTDVRNIFPNPIRSTVAGTNTTIVTPVPGAAVLWRVTAYYYLCP